MKPTQFLLITALAGIMITACKKDNKTPVIKSDKATVEIPAGGAWDTLTITSDVPWQLSVSPASPWLTLDRTAGSAGVTQIFLQTIQNTAHTPRSATLKFTSTGDAADPLEVKLNQVHDVAITSFQRFATGGSVILISGRGFSPVPTENTVKINNQTATVQTATNMGLQVVVPSKVGSGPIEVTVNGKTTVSPMDFIYQWVGVVTTFAGNTAGHLDGAGTAAQFTGPDGIKFDGAGNLIVADYANYKVRKITPAGVVSTLPGRFAPPGSPVNSDFGLPTDVAIDQSGNIYVVEYNSSAISKITPAGTVSLFAGGNAPGYADGTGTAASFNRPVDITVDAANNLYVADRDNHRIRKITPAGVVTTFAGGGHGYADGTGTTARFIHPQGIATDAAGNMYVADNGNHRIRKISPAGVVTTYAGSGNAGNIDGPATEAYLSNPNCIAVDGANTLYVGQNDGIIRVITSNGKVSSVVKYIDASTGANISINSLFGIAVDGSGTIYFSDYWGNKIRKLVLQ